MRWNTIYVGILCYIYLVSSFNTELSIYSLKIIKKIFLEFIFTTNNITFENIFETKFN